MIGPACLTELFYLQLLATFYPQNYENIEFIN